MAPLPLAKPLTYDDASHYVYGMPAKVWKESYQTKATPDQLARYEASKAHHAQHAEEATVEVRAAASAKVGVVGIPLDPCCPDSTDAVPCAAPLSLRPPPALALTVGVLTISDRAFAGVYADASGPMVERCLSEWAQGVPQVTVRVTKRQVPSYHKYIGCVQASDRGALLNRKTLHV
jgi:hypothetical protein